MSRTYKNGEPEKYCKNFKYSGGMVTTKDKEGVLAIKRNRTKRLRLRIKLFLKNPNLISKRLNCYHLPRKNGRIFHAWGWI